MAHFGLVCPSATGHLNTILPLGKELQRRGHRISFFGVLDSRVKTLAAGIDFYPIGEAEFPLGSIPKAQKILGEKKGLEALKYMLRLITQATETLLRDAPPIMKEVNIDALIVDQAILAGGTVAEYLDIPFITLCSALPINQEPAIPPFTTLWTYNPSWKACWRNQIAYFIMNRLSIPTRNLIQKYRLQWQLSPKNEMETYFSPLAQISQIPAELDFPRQQLPESFHYTGPFPDSSIREPIPFPDEQLTDQPLIYASMGTIQNRNTKIFSVFAQACAGLDVQLVISLGGAGKLELTEALPGRPIVVQYAPQLELLKKASLTITHAGPNTVLESLTNAVPMVAIPGSGNDQPGTAARISWTGTGQVIPAEQLTSKKLRQAIEEVLENDSYKQQAIRLQRAIHNSGGVRRAADIIEAVVATGKPLSPPPQIKD